MIFVAHPVSCCHLALGFLALTLGPSVFKFPTALYCPSILCCLVMTPKPSVFTFLVFKIVLVFAITHVKTTILALFRVTRCDRMYIP